MDKHDFYWFSLLIAVGISVALIVTSIERIGDTLNNSKAVEKTAAVQVYTPSKYDISFLEEWGGAPIGTNRMTAGWYHSPDTIETEDGNLWTLNTDEIEEWDLLLIWFDDMGTPEIEDDQIVKVWKAIYE